MSTDNKSLLTRQPIKMNWCALTFDKEQEVNEGVEQRAFSRHIYTITVVNLSCEYCFIKDAAIKISLFENPS